MTEPRLTALFQAVDLSGEPPIPPGEVERLVAAGRRSARRRRFGAALGAITAIVLVAVLVGLGAVPRHEGLTPARPAGTPSLPDRIAPFSFRTGTVSDSPGGRAAMIYVYGSGELKNVWQSLALGADGNTYRHVDAASPTSSWLLSADGRYVTLVDERGGAREIAVVDLTTGGRRDVPLPGPRAVALLAASPDGRYVAYSSAPYPRRNQVIGEAEGYARAHGTLALLELATGRAVEVPALTPAAAAAFSPDGRSIAVQSGTETTVFRTWVYSLDGQRRWEVPMLAGYGLLSGASWSPDGRLLATVGWDGYPDYAARAYDRDGGRIVFVNADGGPGPVPEPVTVEQFLGWRSGDRILAQDGYEISEVRLDGGGRRVLSRFDDGHSCEYRMQPCLALEISAATALLPDLTVRDGGHPDRGPWPHRLRFAALVAALVAGLVVLLVARRARRRRAERRTGRQPRS